MWRSSKQWQEKALAVSIIAGSNYLSIISQPNDVEVPGRDRRVPASISVWMNWCRRVFVQVWFLHSIPCAASGCSLIVGQSAHAPHCLLSSVEMSGEPPETKIREVHIMNDVANIYIYIYLQRPSYAYELPLLVSTTEWNKPPRVKRQSL